MATAPVYVSTPWFLDRFDPYPDGPEITRSGVLISDQGVLDLITAASQAATPAVPLQFSDSAPVVPGTGPLDANPFLRWDRLQALSDDQQAMLQRNAGFTPTPGPAFTKTTDLALVLGPNSFDMADASGNSLTRFLAAGDTKNQEISVTLASVAAGNKLTITPNAGVIGPTDVLAVAGQCVTYRWTGEEWIQQSSYFPQAYFDLLTSGLGGGGGGTVQTITYSVSAYPGRAASGAGTKQVIWTGGNPVPTIGGDFAQPNDVWLYDDGAGTRVIYVADVDRWRAQARPSLFAEGQFVAEQEEPSLNGIGTWLANNGSRGTLATDSTTTQITTDNQVFRNTKFTKIISFSTAVHVVWFFNCEFAGFATSGGSTACLNHTASSLTAVYADQCTFRPSSPSGRENSTAGHHIRATRCLFSWGLDGWHSDGADNQYTGCFIGRVGFWNPETIVPAPHPDGSHNDLGQSSGGAKLLIAGNTMWGFLIDYTFTASASTQLGPPVRRCQQGILLKPDTAGNHSGVVVRKNWWYGCTIGILLGTGAATWATDTVVTGNVFYRDIPSTGYGGTTTEYTAAMTAGVGLYYSTGGAHWTPIRLNLNQTVNGFKYTATGTTTPAAGTQMATNVWADSPTTPVPVSVV